MWTPCVIVQTIKYENWSSKKWSCKYSTTASHLQSHHGVRKTVKLWKVFTHRWWKYSTNQKHSIWSTRYNWHHRLVNDLAVIFGTAVDAKFELFKNHFSWNKTSTLEDLLAGRKFIVTHHACNHGGSEMICGMFAHTNHFIRFYRIHYTEKTWHGTNQSMAWDKILL